MVVELYVWKPWNRLRTWTSLSSWKIGVALLLPFTVLMLLQFLATCVLTGLAIIPFHFGSGLLDPHYDEWASWFNGIAILMMTLWQAWYWKRQIDAAAKVTIVEEGEDVRAAPAGMLKFYWYAIDAMQWLQLKGRNHQNRLKRRFGASYYYFLLIISELFEWVMQLQYMAHMVTFVPYREWLAIMSWLVFAMVVNTAFICHGGLRAKPWSFKFLVR